MIKSSRGIILVAVIAAFAVTLQTGISQPGRRVQRFGRVIGLRTEKVDEYRRLHAQVWPGVLHRLRESNIHNYSIYLKEIEPGKYLLFSYYEYTGSDFSRDAAALAADPEIQAWWKITDPCQTPVRLHKPGEKWAAMDEVFHTE
ncbi:MAG: L-rhamnose mutarotase [Candidatus Latescibacterota bacterium]